jgi:hypothetical protein
MATIRRKFRSRYRRRLKRFLCAACVFACLAVCVVYFSVPPSRRAGQVTKVESARVSLVKRTVFPYSVIPGGSYTRDELSQAVMRDGVVRDHYADFNIDNARVQTLEGSRNVYVSYRLHDAVYWTRNTVSLKPGETILTDGVSSLRARCGNRISERPHLPTSDEEPPLDPIDTPEPPMLAFAPPPELPELPVAAEPPPVVPQFDFPTPPLALKPPSLPAPKGGPIYADAPRYALRNRRVPVPAAPVVPEPSSIVLLGTGFAAVGWYVRRLRRR